MKSRVQELAEKVDMSCDEFIGETRIRGFSEPTAGKTWRGDYETLGILKINTYALEIYDKYLLR